MPSSRRRKVRRHLLGASKKAIGLWWIGRVTVRVMYPSRGKKSTRCVREKAQYGAEKSSLTKESPRGLREASVKARLPATEDKSLSSRVVNHSGRKFIWARKAANDLAKDCKRYNKFPLGILTNPILQERRRSAKRHCEAKWLRLHLQAERMGLHPTVSFHTSFQRFLMIETSRGRTADNWGDILHSIKPDEPPLRDVIIGNSDLGERGDVTRRVIATADVMPKKRVCRSCGYFGSGPHEFNSCRSSGSKPNITGARRQSEKRSPNRFGDLFG